MKHSKYYDSLLVKYKFLEKYLADAAALGLYEKIEKQVMFGESITTYRFNN